MSSYQKFQGRATTAQVANTNSWMEHGGRMISAAGFIAKMYGGMTIAIGSALLVGAVLGSGIPDPVGLIEEIISGGVVMTAGRVLEAAGKTYGQTLENGANGQEESGTNIAQRFHKNYKATRTLIPC